MDRLYRVGPEACMRPLRTHVYGTSPSRPRRSGSSCARAPRAACSWGCYRRSRRPRSLTEILKREWAVVTPERSVAAIPVIAVARSIRPWKRSSARHMFCTRDFPVPPGPSRKNRPPRSSIASRVIVSRHRADPHSVSVSLSRGARVGIQHRTNAAPGAGDFLRWQERRPTHQQATGGAHAAASSSARPAAPGDRRGLGPGTGPAKVPRGQTWSVDDVRSHPTETRRITSRAPVCPTASSA